MPLIGIALAGMEAPVVVRVDPLGAAHGVVISGDRITHIDDTEVTEGESQFLSLVRPLFGELKLHLLRPGARVGEALALTLPSPFDEAALQAAMERRGETLELVSSSEAPPLSVIMVLPADAPPPVAAP